MVNWPEENAAATSNGKYLMENYPSINGSTPKSYPSFWYAFDAGPARFYVLTTSWADGNIGTGSVYANDAAAHWTPSSAEYQWLANDLATHPRSVKFAFWHYPLYADSSGQPSDTSIQGGPGTLQGLLNANNVNIAFNGHAHGYERNAPDAAGLVSYVFGNGGAALGSVSGCSPFDLYAIGSSRSHCGAAPAPASNAQRLRVRQGHRQRPPPASGGEPQPRLPPTPSGSPVGAGKPPRSHRSAWPPGRSSPGRQHAGHDHRGRPVHPPPAGGAAQAAQHAVDPLDQMRLVGQRGQHPAGAARVRQRAQQHVRLPAPRRWWTLKRPDQVSLS